MTADRNLHNRLAKKETTVRRNEMLARKSVGSEEYLGGCFDYHTTSSGVTVVKTLKIFSRLNSLSNNANYNFEKAKALLTTMIYNANFIIKAINNGELLSAEELKSSKTIQNFKQVASFNTGGQQQFISTKGYESFIDSIKLEFACSKKANPSGYINNAKALTETFEYISADKRISKEMLDKLQTQKEKVLQKYDKIYKKLEKNPDCLIDFYTKCTTRKTIPQSV